MRIQHSRGSYEVIQRPIEEAFSDLETDCFLVTDENVHRSWSHVWPDRPTLVLPPGEASKSFLALQRILDWLAGQRALRGDALIAVGGGVIGDLAGFAAATYMRGIRLVQVPTTLMAMVDSSIGGKTGINLGAGKNLVGAFHPPVRVELCVETLGTLPEREFNSGAAEVWKYGCIADWGLFESLENDPINKAGSDLAQTIMRCIAIKRGVVEADEFETTGRRAILNFGHTVSHALEMLTDYRLLHGEAVAIGMVVEAEIGECLGISPTGLKGRLREGLERQGLPARAVGQSPEAVLESMRLDKKATSEGLALSLLDGYGSCKLMTGVSESVVLECLKQAL